MFILEVFVALLIALIISILLFKLTRCADAEGGEGRKAVPPTPKPELLQEIEDDSTGKVLLEETPSASASVESQATTSSSGRSNFYRLHSVYWEAAPEFLRNVFGDLWLTLEGCKWVEDEKSGLKLLQLQNVQKMSKMWTNKQKEIVEIGNSSNWDLQLLCSVLKGLLKHIDSSNVISSVFEVSAMTTKNFDTLNNIRNQLAHPGRTSLDDETFEKLWELTWRILSSMGMKEESFESPTFDSSTSKTEEISTSTSTSSKSAADEAELLRKSGNEYFKQKKFLLAAEEYSKGIDLANVPTELLALLHSNRSVSLLELNDPEGAKYDAKKCLDLRPDWFRGYARLGTAYEKLKKFDKAMENLIIAMELGDNSKPTVDSFEFCNMMRIRLQINEHTDPEILRQKDLTQSRAVGKTLLGNKGAKQFENATPNGLCGMGHCYSWGREGYPQDYEKAADYFGQAAAMEDAEGLYNLAILTQEGKGVRRDVSKGHQLLLRAASKEPTTELLKGSGIKVRTVGVMAACHQLGLAYQYGIAVNVDPQKAAQWYQKALVFGSGMSANNLAIMLFKPFPPFNEMAFDYWRLSAHLGTVRAMENLAAQFRTLGDLQLAQKWFHFALHKGSIDLREKRSLYLHQPSLEKTFDPVEFANLLEKEIRASELGPLLIKIEEFDASVVDPSKFDFRGRKEDSVDLERKAVIVRHRMGLYSTQTWLKESKGIFRPMTTATPKFLPTAAAVDFVGLKEISFKEMEGQKEDKVYERRVLKVTVIDDAILGNPSVGLLVEDAEGHVGRLFVYNYPQRGKETHAELGFGCRLSILHPHLRMMDDGFPGLRVDDPDLILKHSTLRNPSRCRFCGKAEGGNVVCRKCRRVSYCSKACLKKDADDLRHSLVCFKVIS